MGARGSFPRREADHSLPSSSEVKNAWSFISTHPIRFHGVVLNLKKSTGTLPLAAAHITVGKPNLTSDTSRASAQNHILSRRVCPKVSGLAAWS